MDKKIILINPREGSDFSLDLIYAGLVRKFGKENVIDYPFREKHRRGIPKLVNDDEKDYGLERGSLCYVEGCEDIRSFTRPEIVSSIQKDEIDYIFMDETDASYNYWLQISLGGIFNIKTVVIAGHDSFRGLPQAVASRLGNSFYHMFIDDWQESYNHHDFPTSLINLSCNFDHLWSRVDYQKDKKYDICFIGYNSNPIRRMIVDHIEKNWGHLNNCIIFEDRQDKFDRFVRHDEMFKLMAQSKICLNLPGASTGGRALRYYEIPYVGSCMLTMRFPAKLLYPFENLKSCLEFSSLDELDMQIDFARQKSSNSVFNYDIIANEGHRHCLLYHTVDARVDHLFKVLDNQMKVHGYKGQ